MGYGAYKHRHTLTVAAGATQVGNFTGRVGIPDQVLTERLAGDTDLEFSNWGEDGTYDVTNPGGVENVTEVVFEYNHSVTK